MGKALRQFAALCMVLLLSAGSDGQHILTQVMQPAPAGSACNAPAANVIYTAWDSSNVCSGGTCGATFNKITTLHDSGSAGNNAQPWSAVLNNAPLWDGTNTLNGYPTMLLGTPNVTDMGFATGISNLGTLTLWAIIKPASACSSTNCSIVAAHNASSVDWNVHPTTLKLSLDNPYKAVASATSTTAMSTTSFKTVVVEFTFSGGAISYYICSGGTCTADGTATVTTASMSTSTDFGSLGGIQPFVGNIAEFGYFNSISSANRTSIAAWSLCKYGI